MADPHSILKKVFGYDSFRPGQEDIVRRLLDGQDVLAVMPTGAGNPSAIRCRPCFCRESHRGVAAGQPDEGSGGGAGAGGGGGGLP